MDAVFQRLMHLSRVCRCRLHTAAASTAAGAAGKLTQHRLQHSRAVLQLMFVVYFLHGTTVVDADTCICLKAGDLPNYTRQLLHYCDISRLLRCAGPVKDPLFNATLMLNVTGVKAALASGARVNATSDHEYIKGLTPLQVALLTTSEPFWHPYTEAVYVIIQTLLKARADPNKPFPQGSYQGSQDYAGMTPLQYAAHDSKVELVRLLINSGANVNAKGRGGRTALHEAAMCPLLLYAGEKRDVPSPARYDSYEYVLNLLYKSGADAHAFDDKGQMPFQVTPDYTTNCQGTAGTGPTCGSVCLSAREGRPSPYIDADSQYNASLPVANGDCCKNADRDVTSGYNYSRCCLVPNKVVT